MAAKALYEWKSGHAGDLEFDAKDAIVVLCTDPGEGWCAAAHCDA